MKRVKLPEQFDGGKFAARYGLTPGSMEFHAREEGGKNYLYYPDTLPDPDKITLDICDPPPPKPEAVIGRILSGKAGSGDVEAYVKWLLEMDVLPR